MKKVVKLILKVLIWIIAIIVVLCIIFLLYRQIAKKIILNKSLKNNEISEIREINLSGYSQKILLEGKSKDFPLLVILHGGPAFPIPFGNGYRGAYPTLTNNYLVINWDQFGCGNNYNSNQNLKISDYVNMTKDLIKYLRKEFPNNDLYLFGISWGTVLGAITANEMQEDITKYISYGTFTDMNYSYTYLANELLKENISSSDRETINNLLMKRYSNSNILELQKISLKYGLSVQGTDKMDGFIYESIFKLLISYDYTLKDIYNMLFKDISKLKIYQELEEISILEDIKKINIPSYMIQGTFDNQTPHYIINEILEEKTNFHYLELENSGHMLTKQDFNKMLEYIINIKETIKN